MPVSREMRQKAQKKLQGVMAVQALSRLNRSAPHLGKKRLIQKLK
jgi:hypothetical protein